MPDSGEDGLVDGISLVAGVRSGQPRVRTVVLAEKDDPRRAALALQAGASGWVAKDCSLSRLLTVIRGVLRDETHLPPALLTGVLRELTAARKHRTESERLVESLTPREREVLRCMVAGLGRKAVAERLFLSPHTVRTHMQNVLGKLGVHSTLAAVALARRAGRRPGRPSRGCCRTGRSTGVAARPVRRAGPGTARRGSRAPASSSPASAWSARSRPSAVSRTSTPRRSLGSGSRSTRPFLASRSMRLVIVPEVTSVWVSSWPGES